MVSRAGALGCADMVVSSQDGMASSQLVVAVLAQIPGREALYAFFDLHAWPIPQQTLRLANIGVGKLNIARLLRRLLDNGGPPERALDQRDQCAQLHRKGVSQVDYFIGTWRRSIQRCQHPDDDIIDIGVVLR